MIAQIISFTLPPNEYGCVYAWNIATDRLTEDAYFAKKKHLFRWSSFWSCWACKPAKLSHLGYRNPNPALNHCLVRILVERYNWAIFLRKWARRDRYSQWRLLLGHVQRIFVHKNWGEGYWQHLVSTGWRYVPHSQSYTRPVFEDYIINRRADVVWQPRSCDLTSLDYYLWGAVKGSVTPTNQGQLTL